MNRKGVTLKDVAAAAKVSRATAARALNAYGYVGDDTSARVLEVADSLGYRANRVAQALRRGQLPLIGFLPGDIQNPFFARIAHDLEAELRKQGHNLVIASSEESVEQERELLESLRSLSVRGFILAPASAGDDAHIVNLSRDGAPIVLIDRVAENVRCDSVVVDNEGGAREAVDYLVANGHRRIALLRDESRIFTAQERFAGYRNSLQAHGIGIDESLVSVSRSTVEHAIEATIRLFSRRDRPTALFHRGQSDDPRARCWRCARWASPSRATSPWSGSTISTSPPSPTRRSPSSPADRRARSARGPAADRAADGKKAPPRHVRFPTRLVVRGSVAPLSKKRVKA